MSTQSMRARWRGGAAAIGFLALLVLFIAAVLVPGYRLASDLSSKSSALKLASEHSAHPEVIASSLASIRDRLEAGTYVGDALKELADSTREFDRALQQLAQTTAGAGSELRAAQTLWLPYRELLAPVASFDGLPYRDTDAGGTEINDAGRRLLVDARAALAASRGGTARLTAAMSSIASRLQEDVASGAATLRALMVAGVAFACLLVALLGYVQWLKARHERAARVAQNQTRDILATVKDGLFLIDAELRIGAAHSASLGTLLRRERFDGLTFEDLLRDLVPERTLATATKYVKLFWGERANENLIRSINPLCEVEVQIDRGDGRRDVKYLDFEFHRVRGDEGTRQVLVTVDDVTSRVLLAQELKASQAAAHAQVDMLLGLLQADPRQVVAFLDDSSAALGHVNSVLKVPARSDAEFRDKLDQLFREIHRIKGEAAMLGLATVEARAHDYEDLLDQLRQRREPLTGGDFLPLVVRLDDLFGHLKSVRDLVDRVDGLRASSSLSTPSLPASTSTAALDALAQRIAADQGKRVRLVTAGLDDLPRACARPLRDVLIQLVRNAVAHGIEAPEARRAAGKDAVGLLQVQFRATAEGFELVVQDDGAGVDSDRVKAVAVERGLIGAEQARTLDPKGAIALLFRPGFSTRGAQDRDAGRGVGLDLVRRTVQELGGKVGVATTMGKFTRFRILLGPEQTRQDAVA